MSINDNSTYRGRDKAGNVPVEHSVNKAGYPEKIPVSNPVPLYLELRARVQATARGLHAAQLAHELAREALRAAQEAHERTRRPDPTKADTVYLHERRLRALNRSYGE